jgi:hypothetical protein
MTLLPPGVKVHLAFGYIDMRKGIDGLAMLSRAYCGRIPSRATSSCSGARVLGWHRPLPLHQSGSSTASSSGRRTSSRVGR